MTISPKLTITEQRSSSRHKIDTTILGEHRTQGDVWLNLTNISLEGFMLSETDGLARGDRITVRLPVAGYIEAFCNWEADGRAGFQFERPLRVSEFPEIVAALEKRANWPAP